MKNIAVIAIWLGKLPAYFPLWVRSLEVNKEYDFLLFTDQEIQTPIPQNLKIHFATLYTLKEKIRKELGVTPDFDMPYKFCDYRPAFGELFSQELSGYKFWGYCDVDLLFGRLSDFLTTEILIKYKKIFNRGHFALYKNDPHINALYRQSARINSREILESSDCYIFDEWHGIHEIFNEFGIPQYHRECIADILPNAARFTGSNIENHQKQLFVWENGAVRQYFIANGSVHKWDFAYIHFQKRRIRVVIPQAQEGESILLTSKAFLPYKGKITAAIIHKYDQPNLLHFIERYTNIVFKKILTGRQKNAVTINRSLISRPLSTLS
jgi:hypothetical protein